MQQNSLESYADYQYAMFQFVVLRVVMITQGGFGYGSSSGYGFGAELIDERLCDFISVGVTRDM